MFRSLIGDRIYFKSFVVSVLFLALVGFKGCDWFCKNNCGDASCSRTTSVVLSNNESDTSDGANAYVLSNKTTGDDSPVVARFDRGVDAKICFNVQLPKELSKNSIEASLQAMIGQRIDLDQRPKERDIIIADVMKTKSMLIDNLEDLLKNDPSFAEKLYTSFLSLLEVMVFQRIAEKLEKEIVVSKSEVRAEFEANKNRYIEQMGGTKVVVAKFNDQEAAETFYGNYSGGEKVSEAAFIKEGKSFGAEVREMGWLSKEFPRGASSEIIKFLETRQYLPAIELIVSKGEYNVVMFVEQRETVYADPSKNPRIESMLKQKKLMEKINQLTEDTNRKVGATVVPLNNKGASDSSENVSDEEEREFDLDENFSDIDELMKAGDVAPEKVQETLV